MHWCGGGRAHVGGHGGVAQRLGLHEALHVGAPAVIARHQHARRLNCPLANNHLPRKQMVFTFNQPAKSSMPQHQQGVMRLSCAALTGQLYKHTLGSLASSGTLLTCFALVLVKEHFLVLA